MLYSISDVARVLSVSVSLIKVRVVEGKLKVAEIRGNKDTRYFEKSEVERFANECGYKVDELEWLSREEMKDRLKLNESFENALAEALVSISNNKISIEESIDISKKIFININFNESPLVHKGVNWLAREIIESIGM